MITRVDLETISRSAIAAEMFNIWEEEGHDYHSMVDRFLAGYEELLDGIGQIDDGAEALQYELYEIGKRHFGTEKKDLNLWFKTLYMMGFHKTSGARLGLSIELFGREEFMNKLADRIQNPLGLPKSYWLARRESSRQ